METTAHPAAAHRVVKAHPDVEVLLEVKVRPAAAALLVKTALIQLIIIMETTLRLPATAL